MTFVSPSYAVFLCCCLALYWAIPHGVWRRWLLLIASLLFYSLQWVGGAPQLAYLPLLSVSILINYYLGRALGENSPLWAQAQNPNLSHKQWEYAQVDWSQKRLRLLWLGIILNILLLVAFKYIPFLLATIALLFRWPTELVGADAIAERLIPPLGLSFFTFECIAYLVDVYRGAPATDNILEFSAYKLFFPKLISGPITRYHAFNQQVKARITLDWNWVVEGLWLIASGSIKKLLIADHIAVLVNLSLGNLERAGSGDLWLAIFAYGLQLYLDFSGYVDIARGSALLMGINLPINFNFPYLTTNIADFWRRWHMTLGEWLRNYLYFPLGGSRRGLLRTCINLMLVMALAGVWHGNTWGFLIWGILHGAALGIHRITHHVSDRWSGLKRLWKTPLGIVLSWGMTQALVCFSWLFFRLPTSRDYGLALQKLWAN
ncbi:MAG: MBOAT family O-acyltransferase [Cyanobacteria bacterium P01_H01_bin.121]